MFLAVARDGGGRELGLDLGGGVCVGPRFGLLSRRGLGLD